MEYVNALTPDGGVGVSDCSAIVCNDIGNTTRTERDLANLEELIGCLLRSDTVDSETTLDIIEQTEVLARLLDGDNIYTTKFSNSFPLNPT